MKDRIKAACGSLSCAEVQRATANVMRAESRGYRLPRDDLRSLEHDRAGRTKNKGVDVTTRSAQRSAKGKGRSPVRVVEGVDVGRDFEKAERTLATWHYVLGVARAEHAASCWGVVWRNREREREGDLEEGRNTTRRLITHPCGAAVAQWLGRSPPSTAIRALYPAGSLPDFLAWESCWTIPLAGGFSRSTPVSSALPFQRRCILGSGYDGHLRVPAGKPVTRRRLPRPWFTPHSRRRKAEKETTAIERGSFHLLSAPVYREQTVAMNSFQLACSRRLAEARTACGGVSDVRRSSLSEAAPRGHPLPMHTADMQNGSHARIACSQSMLLRGRC
ncbi:hypothetical protein PR048_004453 [Dryococelus australis]|uniref:Uncharacterized protein n=1 Tax=Dryococelus australis TaxID=614101 RepID=A0ABQ9I5H6_9NEOP|nr:hypothetical protein PR048_004453 [Dryococelus australis]